MLYDSARSIRPGEIIDDDKSLSAMEPLSTQITEFSRQLFGPEKPVNYDLMSPYIPLSIYQSAVVQLRLLRKSGVAWHERAVSSLRDILMQFNKRWANAGTSGPA